jgi:hypothetical protein
MGIFGVFGGQMILLLLLTVAVWASPIGDEADRLTAMNKGLVQIPRAAPAEPTPSEVGSVAALDEVGFFGIPVSGDSDLSRLPVRDNGFRERRYGKDARYYELPAPTQHQSGAVLRDPGDADLAAITTLDGKVAQAVFLLVGVEDASRLGHWLTARLGYPEVSTVAHAGVWRSPGAELLLAVIPGTDVSLVQFTTTPGLAAIGGGG